MGVVGHQKALASIPNPIPHATLIIGPEGVGKRLIAEKIAQFVSGVKGLDFQNLGPLDKTASKAMTEHHASHPVNGVVKVTVADLTRSSPQAVNSILKLVEEPPKYSRFVFHSDTEPYLTVRSRCFVVRCGSLTTAEVQKVLQQQGIPEGAAEEASKYSQGRVSLALAHAQNMSSRRDAESIIRSFAQHHAALLEQVLIECLDARKGEEKEETEFRRIVLARLLASQIKASFGADHVLSEVPVEARYEAIQILESKARPTLKVRNAVWLMAMSV